MYSWNEIEHLRQLEDDQVGDEECENFIAFLEERLGDAEAVELTAEDIELMQMLD